MATLQIERTLNGMDVDRLEAAADEVRREPERAQFIFRARNRWEGGARSRAAVQDFFGAGDEDQTREKTFLLDLDEPVALLGTDTGASPLEHLLAALSGCLTNTIVYQASLRGIEIYEVSSSYAGLVDSRGLLGVDAEVRSGFQGIQIDVRVRGNASDEELADLVRVARERSSIVDVLRHGTEISIAAAFGENQELRDL